MRRILAIALLAFIVFSCDTEPKGQTSEMPADKREKPTTPQQLPDVIEIRGIALNPEGIEYNRENNTFLLSSLNAGPIVQIKPDGSFKPFASGEKFPMSTAGLHIDYKHGRLLAAAFNGAELMDGDPATRGAAHLRVYDLKTGVLQQDINLSSLVPEAHAYFANDITVDADGNAYVSDWYARVIYKVSPGGHPTVFWTNETGISGGPNGLDFHPDGYLLVSLLNVNEQGLYTDYGLVKIPLADPASAAVVTIANAGFAGFDGMVLKPDGKVVGITNNGRSPGGNTFIELAAQDNWTSAKVVHQKTITPSTTVAVTPANTYYVINQDFSNHLAENWKIEKVAF